MAGSYKEKEIITLTDMREFIGQTQMGKMTEEELLEIEKRALPTYGTALCWERQLHELSG